MRFSCAARTDVGVVRSGNEDMYLMAAERGLFIVADGMGGHAAGEVASEMATQLIAQEFRPVRGSRRRAHGADGRGDPRVQRGDLPADDVGA